MNFGNEDGAHCCKLLPSADSNIDGLRATISGIRVPVRFSGPLADLAALQGAADFNGTPSNAGSAPRWITSMPISATARLTAFKLLR